MERRKTAQPCGGAFTHRLHKQIVRTGRVKRIPVLALLREGALFQPCEQLQIHAQAPKGELRRVYVQVAKPGQHKPVAHVGLRQLRVALGQRFKRARTHPVHTDQIPIRKRR